MLLLLPLTLVLAVVLSLTCIFIRLLAPGFCSARNVEILLGKTLSLTLPIGHRVGTVIVNGTSITIDAISFIVIATVNSSYYY